MKIGILGATGRMGRMLRQELAAGVDGAVLAGAIGADGDKEALFAVSDVVIDFTVPDAARAHAALAARHRKPLVMGTTGLDSVAMDAVRAASKTVPILYAANMSLGVTLLLSLVEQAADKLGDDFDIEIFEAHHRRKVDAPSGTALALAEAAARGRGINVKEAMETDRSGARVPGTIGMSVFRGGDVVGEHTVTFAGHGERLELAHKATDRAIFARGAIKAALWIEGRKPALYAMRDVLGL